MQNRDIIKLVNYLNRKDTSMKPKKLFTAFAASAMLIAPMLLNTSFAQASSHHELKTAVTKIVGKKNYAIYESVDANGPHKKIANTKTFKYNHLESKEFTKTKAGTYWLLIVNGRAIGWVNQNFFARNALSVAKHVSLVQNSHSKFATKDAISYATNSTGSMIDPNKVSRSAKYIKTNHGGYKYVTYKNHGTVKKVKVMTRVDPDEGISDAGIEPNNSYQTQSTWHGSSKSSSAKWNTEHNFANETRKNNYTANGMTLTTRLYQPHFLSLNDGMNDQFSQVGAIPEGIAMNNNTLAVSLFNNSHNLNGHLVTYNLNKLKDPYAAQNLTAMPWRQFVDYSRNIKVSPYLKLGHGQALGMTEKYIYVLANNSKLKNSDQSEEIMQIRRSDMQLNKIWSIKVWNHDNATPRYFHNATFVNDHTMYGLFHNATKGRYEYWRLTRRGDSWIPEEVAATDSDLISNSPVQGFTYDTQNQNFYVGFNDFIFKMNHNGDVLKDYQFDTKRELEGLSADQGKLNVELTKRAELLQTNIK